MRMCGTQTVHMLRLRRLVSVPFHTNTRAVCEYSVRANGLRIPCIYSGTTHSPIQFRLKIECILFRTLAHISSTLYVLQNGRILTVYLVIAIHWLGICKTHLKYLYIYKPVSAIIFGVNSFVFWHSFFIIIDFVNMFPIQFF